MKKLFLLLGLALVTLPVTAQQSSNKPAPTAVAPASAAAQPNNGAVAPTVDEKTLKISDSPGTTGNTANPTNSGDPDFWTFLRMFLILAAVIGMIIGFIYLLRRLSGQAAQNNNPIKVLHTHVLGGSRTLYLVEVGEEILLVGSGDSSVNLVKEITDQETIDAIRLAASQNQGAQLGKNFGSILGKFMGKKERVFEKVEEPVDNSADFLKKQRDRLKKL